ncbi:hypothetical protein [Bacillus sp. T3]|uniref:hypothetical protein n=1 Tax=Bacillus sp. T3 TaxID=467262 RepID=UPI002981F1BB|nr:hypothetical protein [Bacillus sp. T3]
MYTITKIGQLKTNIPIFIGISFLLLIMFIRIFIVYRKHMKKDYIFEVGSQIDINDTQLVIVSRNSTDRHDFPLASLTKIKENKKWYFLYFHGETFIPISKKTEQSLEQIKIYFNSIKPILPIYWKWSAIFISLSTLLGVYYVGSNAVNFNGALAWKIYELKTDTGIKLKNDNFYTTKLDGILASVKEEMELEPFLMTNNLEIEFEQDGTITEIYMYIYGFDQNQKLQSGYLIYTKGNKVKVHKQDWNGQGTTVYDPNNDLSIVINMLKLIPIKSEVKDWNEDNYAVLYKGIRTWSSSEGIRFIDQKGKIHIPSTPDMVNSGPSISLYVPGKEDLIIPKRYVYRQFYREDDVSV